MVVFIHHGYSMWFKNSVEESLVYLAHFAVIVFFVLSGYLIAYTTSVNPRGLKHYASARLGRLYSVLLPALLVTAVCQLVVYFANPVVFSQYTRAHTGIRYILSGLFINEAWFFSASPPINGPLWSLSYEFWYYVIFGVFFFLKNSFKKYSLLLLVLLMAGPPILSMMPVWLCGCFAYKLSHTRLTKNASWLVFTGGLLTALVLQQYLPALPFSLGRPPLFYANQFIKDFIVSIFLSISLYAATGLQTAKQKSPQYAVKFRVVADLTFSLYLLHFPLLVLWRAIFPSQPGNGWQFVIAMVCVAAVITPLGLYLEKKRPRWDNFFANTINASTKRLTNKHNKPHTMPSKVAAEEL